MAVSLYDITFKETFDQKVLCKLMLGEEDIAMLQSAIEDLYYFEFVYGKSRGYTFNNSNCCVVYQMTCQSEGF